MFPDIIILQLIVYWNRYNSQNDLNKKKALVTNLKEIIYDEVPYWAVFLQKRMFIQ